MLYKPNPLGYNQADAIVRILSSLAGQAFVPLAVRADRYLFRAGAREAERKSDLCQKEEGNGRTRGL